MRRAVGSDDRVGAWVDHVWYPDTGSVAYVVAKAAVDERRRVRRARLLALIEAERGEDGYASAPG